MNSNQDAPPRNYLDADWPIESRSQDLLNRSLFAEKIARQVSNVPANQGFTIAITGEWGSGKTSLLNMVAETIGTDEAAIAVLRFNPWLFGAADDLVTRFFGELSAQLGQSNSDRLKSVARGLSGLGQALAPLSPFAGTTTVVNLAAQVTASLTEPPSLHKKRDELKDALSKSNTRLIIILDDIDRLEPSETREIMRLVRLTSDLPNVVHLLAFDRRRVAMSLAGNETETEGQRYLDKIVQDSYHLPMPRISILSEILVNRLNKTFEGRDLPQIDRTVWSRVLYDVINPLVGNLRDVKRYVNSLPVALEMVGNEIALADLLGLEAIRILRPNIFDALKAHPEYLVHSDEVSLLAMSEDNRTKAIQEGLQSMLEQAGDDKRILESLLEVLFSATNGYLGRISHGPNFNSTWRARRRVACEDVLQIYLHAGLDEGVLQTRDVQGLVESLTDEKKLSRLLHTLDEQHLEEALERILDFGQDFPVEAVPTAVPVFINLMGKLSAQPMGMFSLPPRIKASQVAYQLLRRMRDPDALASGVSEMLGKIDSLSGQFDLIEMVGHHESVGHRLISEEKAKELEREFVRNLESAAAKELSDEWDIYALCYRTLKLFDGVDENRLTTRLRQHLSEDGFVLSILRTAIGYRTTNGHTEKLLSWDGILEVFGEEFMVAVERLARSPSYNDLHPDDQYLVNLGQKFASGWRPKRWFNG